MKRMVRSMAAACSAAVALAAVSARAAAVWPTFEPGIDFPGAEWISRGAGGGLAIVPLVCWWLWSLGWAATSDWVTRDSAMRDFRPNLWGPLVTFPFAVAAILAWWIPWAWAGQLLMLVAWLAPTVAYCVQRNAKVKEAERVLTKAHAMRVASGLLGRFGVELPADAVAAEIIPTVKLAGGGGRNADENKQRLEKAAAMPGFADAEAVMLGAVIDRASSILLEAGPDSFVVRHEVDGVWHPLRQRKPAKGKNEKEMWVETASPNAAVGQAVVAAIKALAGIDLAAGDQERKTFSLQVDGKTHNCHLSSKGGVRGTKAIVTIEAPGVAFKTCRDLGMSEAIAGRLAELLTLEKGLIVLSSPPGSGLTTTFDVVLQSADRLVRDFVSIEDAVDPPREIQNVKAFRFDARNGTTAAAALELAMRDYPRAVVTRELKDEELAKSLAGLAEAEQLVIVSVNAEGAIEAIGRLLTCGIPPEKLAKTLLGSFSQRLVRKLCPRCRQEYPTPPELLMKLKRTAEQLPHLWRASQHGCRLCVGTGYFGRAAVFEMASGTTVRRAIAAKVDAKTLRQAALKDGMLPLRDEGMAMIVEGVTSLEEMQRAFAKG